MTPALIHSRQRLTDRLRDERGTAVVEFALVLPILMVLLVGMLDFGKAIHYWLDETHLANEGARWAAVDKNPGAPDQTLQEAIKARATSEELREGGTDSIADGLQVCIDFPDDSSEVGDPVQVTLSVTYDWMPFIDSETGLTETTLSTAATMRLEAEPTTYEAGCA
jgi:Flp pilus assembly protein TadG